MQWLIGLLVLSMAIVTPLWASRVILIGIVTMLAGERQRTWNDRPNE